MDIVKRTRQEYDSMTKTEQQAASYFLLHLNDFAFDTLEKISHAVGTSTTTVIRFCRRLGFAGYKEFQDQLREELKYHLSLPDKLQRARGTVADELLSQIVRDGIQAIDRTFAELPYERLTAAVDSIDRAKRVFVFGMRESFALVHYTYTRLITVRKEVHILDVGYNHILEPVLNLTPEDLCIFYLFHRYTEQSLQILPLLRQQGVPVVLITAPPYEQVESYAEILLPCYVENTGIKNTALAPICLADYLCNALAIRSSESIVTHFRRIEDLLQSSAVLGSYPTPAEADGAQRSLV